MKKRFWLLILIFCKQIVTSQQEKMQNKKYVNPIRQALIAFAAEEREKEKQNKLRIKKQREERLLAYKLAKERFLEAEIPKNSDKISFRKNPTETQIKKQENNFS